MLAAPASGAGKTLLTLAITRALCDAGQTVRAAKAGPDYIDPTFHAIATGRSSSNLDGWAMRPDLVRALATGAERLVVEGAMGLFDGPGDGSGSAASLAAMLELPVVLILDASRCGQSLGPVLRGFATHDRTVRIAGVLVNRVASDRHARMVRAGLDPVCDDLGIAPMGMVPRDAALALPERHLGLVPASEQHEIEAFIERAATVVRDSCDMDALAELERGTPCEAIPPVPLPPLGQRIAVARDRAFAFAYPHLLEGWQRAGASVQPFSPLGDEGPDAQCDAVFLPGGYPELHAGRLAEAGTFRTGMEKAVARGAWVYGECGGYMSLGEVLTDAEGVHHAMLGLLPVETSFAERRLHLGYRHATSLVATPFGDRGTALAAHEFHHSSIVKEDGAARLFRAADAEGRELRDVGLARGRVFGSYLHLIDRR